MKKLMLLMVFSTLLYTAGVCQQSNGEAPYNNGLGLFIDFGEGTTFVGPHLKHYFNGRDAVQGMLLFGNGVTILGVEYSYNVPFPDVDGLRWNLGIGPQMWFWDGGSGFALRPLAGLEFKVPNAPISMGFDWRPIWDIGEESGFLPGRFGIAFKYTF